jgi:hypothetical protein
MLSKIKIYLSESKIKNLYINLGGYDNLISYLNKYEMFINEDEFSINFIDIFNLNPDQNKKEKIIKLLKDI